jgi:hypothetical protein
MAKKKPYGQKPTAEQVIKRATSGETRFADRNTAVRFIREHRHRKQRVQVPEAYTTTSTVVRTPLVSDVIQRVAAMIAANGYRITVMPYGDTAERQKIADRIERALNAEKETSERRGDRNLFFRFVDSTCETGLGIRKVLFKKDLYQDIPLETDTREDGTLLYDLGNEDPLIAEEAAERFMADDKAYRMSKGWPFLRVNVDPETCFYWYDDEGLAEVVEVGEVDRSTAMRRYGLSEDQLGEGRPEVWTAGATTFVEGRGPKDGDRVKEYQYWDRQWYCHVVGSAVVKCFRHGYGRPPYFIAHGIESNSNLPDEQVKSVADPWLALAPIMDTTLTELANVAHLLGFPTLFLEAEADAPLAVDPKTGKLMTIEYKPGQLNKLPPGHKLTKPLEPDSSASLLLQFVSVLQGFGDMATLAPVLRGQGGAEQAGYAISQLMVAGQSVFNPIANNIARALEQELEFMLECLAKHWKYGPIYVLDESTKVGDDGKPVAEWLSLDPADLDPLPHVQVHVDPILPVDNIAQGNFGVSMMAAGLVDDKWVREEKLGILDNSAMEKRVFMMQEKQNPQLREMALQAAMAKLGMGQVQPGMMPSHGPAPQEGFGTGMPFGPGQPSNQPGLGGPMPGEATGSAAQPDPGGPGNAGPQW